MDPYPHPSYMQCLQIYPREPLPALFVLLSRAIPLPKSSRERSGQEYLETSVKNSDKHCTVTRSCWERGERNLSCGATGERDIFLFLFFSLKINSLVSKYRKMPLQSVLGAESCFSQSHRLTREPSLAALRERCCRVLAFDSSHAFCLFQGTRH